MPQKIRLWEVTPQKKLSEISVREIDFEERLEDWLESDISMLDQDLMVIGRQVHTDFGGEIDLLCMDPLGGLVVVELKKGRTPREVTAQALDYASWVKGLSFQHVRALAEAHLKGPLEEAFSERFGNDLPETLNQNRRSLIVAEEIDASTERIIRYLSDFGVPVNVATIQHFLSENGKEMLAQVFLIEPEAAETRSSTTSKRRPYVNTNEMAALADQVGVGDLYGYLSTNVAGIFSATSPRATSRGFQYRRNQSVLMLFVVDLELSEKETGLRFRFNGTRALNHFGVSEERIRQVLPPGVEEMPTGDWQGASREQNWLGFKGYFRTREDIDKFLSVFKQ